jgi:imidazolonepropionase-like amidohydrolase
LLQLATRNNAAELGLEKVTGTLTPGKSADLVVLAQNPLEDLRVLEKVEAVVCRGEWVPGPAIYRVKGL